MTGRLVYGVLGAGVVLLGLGCSGMFGGDKGESDLTEAEPEEPLALPAPDAPSADGLPATSGWEQHRLHGVRMGVDAPSGWTVTEEGETITVVAPSGGTARIQPTPTCSDQRNGKRQSGGTIAFEDQDRVVWETTSADGTLRCGVVAGRAFGDETWCAVADDTTGPALTKDECLALAAMVETLQQAPAKKGGDRPGKGSRGQ